MSNDSSDNEDKPTPKIIVDSDWKEQVAKEKEASLKKEASVLDNADSAQVSSEETSEKSTESTSPKSATPTKQPLPPASFDVLVSMLFTQAFMSLGQMPNPDGETTVDKPMAKHSIDMIEMLDTKTKGNLSSDESKMLSEALHALRMAYVSVRG
jgi:hypothetical protein